MFNNVVQPPIISLFSSTGSRPLELFSQHLDSTLRADSVIQLLNDVTGKPAPPAPAILAHPKSDIMDEDGSHGQALCQTVLHLQSPTLRTTYIRCPPLNSQHKDLGIKHPWLHLQVRPIGREWTFEFGVIDQAGRRGVIRCSTFQMEPSLKTTTSRPLLHLPLSFPSSSSHPLTSWSTISVDVAALMPHFTSMVPSDSDVEARANLSLPSGQFSSFSYIKVNANCRLRRIWFSEARRTEQVPWEFGLYSTPH